MNKTELLKIIEDIKLLKKENLFTVDVRNSEWFSLFKNEIRNSIAIEGIFANKRELKSVLEKGRKTDTQKSAAILGYFEAAQTSYTYALNLYEEREFNLRVADIKQMHSLLMKYEKEYGFYNDDIGVFRISTVEVTDSNFKPLEGMYVNEVLEIYVEWINYNIKNIKPENVIKFLASSHVFFETIHPFKDGNGRVGRILLNFLLIGMGFINITIKGTSKKDREIYYNSLEKADNKFEILLRKYEKGEKFSIDDLNRCMKESQLEDLENLIINGIKSSINVLRKNYMIKDIEKVLPLKEIAEITDYSQDYLRNLINRGKIKGTKINNKWHIKVKDIYEYMEKNK